MTKNVIVLDEFGNQTGLTYPKRARGLVKNGRAEYANGCETEIRLLSAHAPAEKTEELIMSNVINFNAREFKFDETCESKAGSRILVTDGFGNNIEQFEIGDWNWTWTQIACEKRLEKNTDYVFRFAMTGGHNDTEDAVSQFIIVPRTEGGNLIDDWDDRWVYPLDKSRFKPVLSKRDDSGMIRVYEIPFNSGDSGIVRLMFVAQHAVARFMQAYENEKYAELEDLTYEQWLDERRNNIDGCDECGWNNGNINLSGAVISENALNKIMEKVTSGANINLSGAVIGDDFDDEGEDFDYEKFDRIAEECDEKFGSL